MKLAYIYPEALPSQKARAIQVVYTCQALAQQTERLYLCLAQADCPVNQIFSYYGLQQPDNLEILLVRRKFLLFHATALFNWQLRGILPRLALDVVITRHLQIVPGLQGVHLPLIFEAHQFVAEKRGVSAKVIRQEEDSVRQADAIGSLTHYLQQKLTDAFHVTCPQLVIPSGTTVDAAVAGKQLGKSGRDFLYAGTMRYAWKGMRTLLEAVAQLTDARLHLIGKLEGDWEETHPLIQKLVSDKKLILYGYMPPDKVREKMREFEVTVLPNTADDSNSRFYTSPLKLLEYMAAKTAIVASDLPSIHEIASEREVLFVEPENPKQLAAGIEKLLGDAGLRATLAENAWHKVQDYSWEKRAARFIELANAIGKNKRNS